MNLTTCTSYSLAAATVGLATTLATAGPVIAPGWGYPVFQDNFDAGSIDPGLWQIGNWAASNNGELQYYHPNQVSVSDGTLRLRADRDPSWSFGREYNSGHVRTWQEWSYGRVEVRAKVPYGQGFWPAIWLLPRTASWPAGGEIDIMEARGDRPWGVSSALHWGWDEASHQHVANWFENGANFQEGFHDYAVEWEVGTVRFYVDGVEHFTLYEPAVGIPGTPKSIILNLAVGGNFSGYPDGTTPFPSQFEIDHVRVWQRSEPTPPPVSLVRDPGFEENAGALDNWARFGNTIDNVTSDWGTPLDGTRSLKLYGQFDGAENYSGVTQSFLVNPGDRFAAGSHALTRSEDSVAGTGNTAIMKVEFYSQAGAPYGSADFIGESEVTIADASAPEDTWSYAELSGVVPQGTVEARLTLLFRQPASNPGGSVFIDSVTFEAAACTADVNNDGLINFFDLSAYLAAFQAGAPVADLTGDGAIDFFDIGEYLALFVAGCP